jgi:DNA replication protein DnaC
MDARDPEQHSTTTVQLFSGADIGLKTLRCPRCKRELLYFKRPSFKDMLDADGKVVRSEWSHKYSLALCECEVNRRRIAEEQRQARDKQDWIDRCIKRGNIDPRFQDANFKEWPHTPETEPVYEAAFKCAQAVSIGEKDSGLILLGGVGNGKNTLAACICRYVAEHFRTFAYQSVPALLQSLKDTYDSDDGERESSILHALTSCDLLVLNDWGAEKWTPWTEGKLYYIIDSAYNQCRNAVVTSNAVKMKREPGDAPGIMVFSELMEERTYDRLLQMCSWTVNEGGSFRRAEAKARRKG